MGFGQGFIMGGHGYSMQRGDGSSERSHARGGMTQFGMVVGSAGSSFDQQRRRAGHLADRAADNALAWTDPKNLIMFGGIVVAALVLTR
jgi:hypothetical protein